MKKLQKVYYIFLYFFCYISFCISRPFILSFEGVSGAGKSTLSKIFADAVRAPLGLKFSSQFTRSSVFNDFLNDKKRWAYTISHYFLTMRLDVLNNLVVSNQDKGLVILERSPYTQLFTFSRLFWQEGDLSDVEWLLFKKEAEILIELCPYKPDAVVYIRTPADTCFERVQARKEQKIDAVGLPLEFLQALEICHEDWLKNNNLISQIFAGTPILILDGFPDFKNDPIVQQEYIEKIKNFIDGERDNNY